MKKIMVALMVFTAMLLTASVTTAQAPVPMKITKGVKIGINMSKAAGDDADLQIGENEFLSPKNLMGISGGFFIGFQVAPSITIQPELLYSMKGTKYELGDESETLKLDYLAIPVLVKYGFSTPGNIKPCIFVGGEFALTMTAKEKYEGPEGSDEVDIKEYVKSTDLGFVVGAGVDVNAGMRTVMFDVRYVMGLTDVPDAPEGATGTSLKNSTLMVTAGLGF